MRPHHPSLRATFSRALAVMALFLVSALARDAQAVGSFKIKSTEINEVSGAWHIYATVELAKPPSTAHQVMKFYFTKLAVYERSLVDGKTEPVMNRQALKDQQPSMESLEVGFGDASGKIFKITRFDFGLTRTRGFEAGEYKVEVKTSDGTPVGQPATITLKGDNPPVDRRAMNFNAKEPSIKKVDAYDAGANQAKNDDGPSNNGMGAVTPTGTAKPFIAKEGFEKTPEEEIKTRPKGCGCAIPGASDFSTAAWLVPIAALGLAFARRRKAVSTSSR